MKLQKKELQKEEILFISEKIQYVLKGNKVKICPAGFIREWANKPWTDEEDGHVYKANEEKWTFFDEKEYAYDIDGCWAVFLKEKHGVPQNTLSEDGFQYVIEEIEHDHKWLEELEFENSNDVLEAIELGEVEYLRRVNFDAQEKAEQLEETITDLQLAIVELYEGGLS